jgi:Fe-S oxidoreductase
VTNDQTITVDFKQRDAFLEMASLEPAICFQCGTCTATCPWGELLNNPITVRKMIHQAQLGLKPEGLLWYCTTCKICENRCPREVGIVESLLAMRKLAFKNRLHPIEFESLLWNVLEEGNPLGEPKSTRANWARDMNLKDASEGVDVLFYAGCTASYDPRLQKVARSLAWILGSTDVDFGILGNNELCCGDSVRSTGENAFLETLIEKNLRIFKSTGATKIVTISPHCYDMFFDVYRKNGLEIEVVHYTQFIHDLWSDGEIELTAGLKKVVTYHDPCYLTRYHGIYNEPRSILEGIKNLEYKEMKDNRENTLCCGGGGGRMWLETEPGQRLSDLRVKQANDTNATIMVTACPYCIQNFEDSIKMTGVDIEIKDLAEVVAEAMGFSQE